jgi:hypothetical protein
MKVHILHQKKPEIIWENVNNLAYTKKESWLEESACGSNFTENLSLVAVAWPYNYTIIIYILYYYYYYSSMII